eukprot:gene23526-9049_t
MTTFASAFNDYLKKVKGHSALHYVPSFNDMNSMVTDDIEGRSAPPQHVDETPAVKIPTVLREGSSYEKSNFELTDLHKVNRPVSGQRQASHQFDIPTNGSPSSIWEIMEKAAPTNDDRETYFATPQGRYEGDSVASPVASNYNRSQFQTSDIHKVNRPSVGNNSANRRFDIPRNGDNASVWEIIAKSNSPDIVEKSASIRPIETSPTPQIGEKSSSPQS